MVNKIDFVWVGKVDIMRLCDVWLCTVILLASLVLLFWYPIITNEIMINKNFVRF